MIEVRRAARDPKLILKYCSTQADADPAHSMGCVILTGVLRDYCGSSSRQVANEVSKVKVQALFFLHLTYLH